MKKRVVEKSLEEIDKEIEALIQKGDRVVENNKRLLSLLQ